MRSSGLATVLAALAVCATAVTGCTSASEDPGHPVRDFFVGFGAQYTVHTFGSGRGEEVEERVSTCEEVLEEAQIEARKHDRRGPIGCVLVLKDDGGAERSVTVFPLSLEGLQASGVEMTSVEMVFLFGDRVPDPRRGAFGR